MGSPKRHTPGRENLISRLSLRGATQIRCGFLGPEKKPVHCPGALSASFPWTLLCLDFSFPVP